MGFQIPKKEESLKIFNEKIDDFFDKNKESFIEDIVKGFEDGRDTVLLSIPFFYKKRFKEIIIDRILKTFRGVDRAWDFEMEINDVGIVVRF